MAERVITNSNKLDHIKADCEKCFALCCVALPYARSADFAFDKDSGIPCPKLQSNNRCGIHKNLRKSGFQGCSAYECFGAGQKVSQFTYEGNSWRDNPEIAAEMFEVFPIMQQLHEMLYYLNEAVMLKEALPIYSQLQMALNETEFLTELTPAALLNTDVPAHRAKVSGLLLQTSELVRAKVSKKSNNKKIQRGSDLIGAKLRRANLRGANLRGALLIAADLTECDLNDADLLGTDFRGADLSGAALSTSLFLTQAQINSAKGNQYTKLPTSLSMPEHWL
ncbi:pentapeptide repeat-containing protein [Peribacillus sp. SCS-155]|uniref:pentapeptide repeat-containing protein n=1 Tax=Peribacillus sedimenti TaxID=3115297 RepID=UPI003906B827